MNQKTKMILAVVLVAGGGAVWVPQFSGARSSDRPAPRAEVPADGPVQPPRPPAAGVRRAGDASDASHAASGATASAAPADLESTLAAAESLTRPHGDLDLAALLAALDPARIGATDAAAASTAVRATNDADLRALERFAEEHVLTGTIGGPDPVALFGHRVVRVGDLLDGEDVTVAAIEASAVVLRRGEARLRVTLAPFRARRASATPSLGSEPVEDAAGAGAGPQAAAGGSEPPTDPANLQGGL